MSVAVQREVDRERGDHEHTETAPDRQQCDRLHGRGLYVESASVWQPAAGRELAKLMVSFRTPVPAALAVRSRAPSLSLWRGSPTQNAAPNATAGHRGAASGAP